MAAPWEKYGAPAQPASSGPWQKYAAPVEAAGTVPERKGLFTTRDTSGNVSVGGYAGDAVKGVWDTLSNAGEAFRKGDTSPEGIDAVIGLGALGTPLTPGVRVGEGAMAALAPAREAPAAVPTGAALRSAADEGYQAARDLDVVYRPPAVSRMAGDVIQALQREGIHPTDAPGVYGKLKMLAEPPAGVTGSAFSELESARKGFGRIAKDNRGKTEETAAGYAIRALDDFFANPSAESVLSGPADAVSQIVKDARGNYAAAMRSQEVVGREQKALRRSYANNSGKNIDNKMRQRASDLLENPKLTAGFSLNEKQALEDFVKGTFTQNSLRDIGNTFGGGGGLGQYGGIGAGAFLGGHLGPAGAVAGAIIPPVTGRVAKALENRLARKHYALVDELIRSRSPLMEKQPPKQVYANPELRALLVRALLSGAATPQQSGGGGF